MKEQPKLQVQVWLSTKACNKSSYILSPHKNKSHALSRSLYFKPAQVTSDLSSSCSNSALQTLSSCAWHEQQTCCLMCSFSSSIHSFKERTSLPSLLKSIYFHIKSTNIKNLTLHKITEKTNVISLHCEMNLQTSTTYSHHEEAPSAPSSFTKAQDLCPVFLGKVNYLKNEDSCYFSTVSTSPGTTRQKYTVWRRSDSHIKLHKTETGTFAAEHRQHVVTRR